MRGMLRVMFVENYLRKHKNLTASVVSGEGGWERVGRRLVTVLF